MSYVTYMDPQQFQPYSSDPASPLLSSVVHVLWMSELIAVQKPISYWPTTALLISLWSIQTCRNYLRFTSCHLYLHFTNAYSNFFLTPYHDAISRFIHPWELGTPQNVWAPPGWQNYMSWVSEAKAVLATNVRGHPITHFCVSELHSALPFESELCSTLKSEPHSALNSELIRGHPISHSCQSELHSTLLSEFELFSASLLELDSAPLSPLGLPWKWNSLGTNTQGQLEIHIVQG